MRFIKQITFLGLIGILGSCAYYNTFFNAEQFYRVGVEKKNNLTQKQIPPNIKAEFENAILRGWKVLDFYGDSSAWADDALLLIGKSYFHIEDYEKSENVLSQFILNYPKSPLIPEAQLWLAKLFLKADNTEEAVKNLSVITETTEDTKLKSEAFFELALIYNEREEYGQVESLFKQAIEHSEDEELIGNAYYQLGNTQMLLQKYPAAIASLEEVTKADIAVNIQFDAILQISKAYSKLEDEENAKLVLQNVLSDLRFEKQHGLAATELVTFIEAEKEYDYALEKYKEVIEKYKKSEGAAFAAFYAAELYELELGRLDSATHYYEQSSRLYPNFKNRLEAIKKKIVLDEYLQYARNIKKDKEDIVRLNYGESLVDDDTLETVAFVDSSLFASDSSKTEDSEKNEQSSAANNSSVETKSLDGVKNEGRSDGNNTTETEGIAANKAKKKKPSVARTMDEIEKSLLKNRFNISEFFLLNYLQYDSALVRYNDFVHFYEDSLLTPKAYYSIYFIYASIQEDSVMADSVKNVIIQNYPDTEYAAKLLNKKEKVEEINPFSTNYLMAEEHISSNNYNGAINTLKTIAKQDSGSALAKKSRYAVAYIYEHYLEDYPKAIEAYTLLVNEYPKSKEARIGKNKIAPAPKEVVVEEDASEDKDSDEGPKTEKEVKTKVKIEKPLEIDALPDKNLKLRSKEKQGKGENRGEDAPKVKEPEENNKDNSTKQVDE